MSGKGQLRQAFKLTFEHGALAPFRVVGPASFAAWFLQYSVMGFVFQSCDNSLSKILDVKPVYYGDDLFTPGARCTFCQRASSPCCLSSGNLSVAALSPFCRLS